MPTREEQKELRRQEILFASLELFIKKGYAATRISDIAKKVNMSTGLLFHYYESKEALYIALIRLGMEGPNSLADLKPTNELEFFTMTVRYIFESIKQSNWIAPMFVLMAQAQRSEGVPEEVHALLSQIKTIDRCASLIASGQAKNYFREGDPLALAITFWCSLQGVIEQYAAMLSQSSDKAERAFSGLNPEWIVDVIRKH